MLTLHERGAILKAYINGGLDLTALAVAQLLEPFESVLLKLFKGDPSIFERIGYKTFGFKVHTFTFAPNTELSKLFEFSQKHEEGWIILDDTQLQPSHPPCVEEQTLYRARQGYIVREVRLVTSRNIFVEYFDALRAKPSLVRFVQSLEYWRLPIEEVADRWSKGETLKLDIKAWSKS